MPDTLSQQANKAVIDDVKRDKPSQFTVGGRWDGTRIVGGVTFDRTWANGWGATAYARAWWDDLPVSVGRPRKPSGVEVGGEITKKF